MKMFGFFAVLIITCLMVSGCTAKASVQKSAEVSGDNNISCPQGINDDPSPGTCWAFVDENKDGLCDSSQP